MTITITEPGVHDDIPEDVYHADPVAEGSLSSSGAKTLLDCPAQFWWEQQHGRPDKREFDFGTAAHAEVLGVGRPVEVIDATDRRTKAVQEQEKAARAEGKVPLLTDEWARVQAMAAALRQHPVASALLHPESGRPEVSAFWRDAPTGVMRRARFDWLRHPNPSGRLLLVDYKSAVTADPRRFGKSVASYMYHLSAAAYLEGARALDLADDDAAFLFVVQQKTAPYLVSVCELDALALRIGRELNRRAVDTYVECRTNDNWPGYGDDVALVSLPTWAIYSHEEEQAA